MLLQSRILLRKWRQTGQAHNVDQVLRTINQQRAHCTWWSFAAHLIVCKLADSNLFDMNRTWWEDHNHYYKVRVPTQLVWVAGKYGHILQLCDKWERIEWFDPLFFLLEICCFSGNAQRIWWSFTAHLIVQKLADLNLFDLNRTCWERIMVITTSLEFLPSLLGLQGKNVVTSCSCEEWVDWVIWASRLSPLAFSSLFWKCGLIGYRSLHRTCEWSVVVVERLFVSANLAQQCQRWIHRRSVCWRQRHSCSLELTHRIFSLAVRESQLKLSGTIARRRGLSTAGGLDWSRSMILCVCWYNHLSKDWAHEKELGLLGIWSQPLCRFLPSWEWKARGWNPDGFSPSSLSMLCSSNLLVSQLWYLQSGCHVTYCMIRGIELPAGYGAREFLWFELEPLGFPWYSWN